MSERTTVNGAPCVRDQAGNEWYATDEGGIFFDGEGDCELHGEDLRWLLSPEARGEPAPSPQTVEPMGAWAGLARWFSVQARDRRIGCNDKPHWKVWAERNDDVLEV